MKQVWMWTDDASEGWVGEHATREAALEEIKVVMAGAGLDDEDIEVFLAPVDAEQVKEGEELVFLGPKEKITSAALVAA